MGEKAVSRVQMPNPCGSIPRESQSVLALELLLSETVAFLLKAGVPRDRLRTLLQTHVSTVADERCKRLDARLDVVYHRYQQVVDMSGIVAAWHRESKYTGPNGQPKALAELVLRGLIAERVGRANEPETFEALCVNKIVRLNKQGNYVLRSARTLLFSDSESALVRAAVLVQRFLAVAHEIVSEPRANRRDINRAVHVRHLPEKYLPLWRQLVEERTQLFLEGLDNWLEDHNEPNSDESTVAVGAHIYTYVARTHDTVDGGARRGESPANSMERPEVERRGNRCTAGQGSVT